MCGLFGYIGREELLIEKNILNHRGPDDWGVKNYQLNNQYLTFFQSRLSIIGLGDQGHQPFEKYSGKILIYNGEVYNYILIKHKLINELNIRFITDTDTEVIYEAIVNWGLNKTLEEINGVFAFSFFDLSKEEVVIVRDNLGVKPLYYSMTKNNLVFSSEIKPFFELNLRKPILDINYLGEYFANGWVYEPNTLFENVNKLSAGHYLKLSLKKMHLDEIQYWDIIDKTDNIQPDIEFIVNSQTISDVPIGNYFSGGIDSSIITYLLKDENLLNLNLNMGDGESKRVALMKKEFNLKISSQKFQKENLSTYEKLIYYMDEPIADPAIIPAYLLARESRKLNRIVMLSGMGGDEIDAGYSRHKIINSKYKILIAQLMPKRLIKIIFNGKMRRDIFRLKEFSNDRSPENYFSLTSYFSKSEICNLTMNEDWHNLYKEKINKICKNVLGKKKYFYLDIKGFLASHNLIYMDKASMAASVEVRVPFLDKDLAKYFFIDIDSKKNVGKRRLTSFLKAKIGHIYEETKKSGFSYDIEKWLKNDIDWDEIIIFYKDNNLLNVEQIKEYVKCMERDIESVAMKLWIIYTLYLWLRTFNVNVKSL